jgi:hypothetical protein
LPSVALDDLDEEANEIWIELEAGVATDVIACRADRARGGLSPGL